MINIPKNEIPLKIGFLLDSKITDKYAYDLINWAFKKDKIIVSDFIIQEIKSENYLQKIFSKKISYLIASQFFKFITFFESKILSKSLVYSEHLKKFDILSHKINTVKIKPKIGKFNTHRFSSVDIRKIKNLKLDIIIRCCSGILKGEILNSSKYGIISFHHGDNSIFRGGPAGFWEVLKKNKNTGAIIQILTDELDGGKVIWRGNFPTQHYYLYNQAFIYSRVNVFLKQILIDLQKYKKLPLEESFAFFSGRITKLPNIQTQIKYLFFTYFRLILTSISKKINLNKENWKVAIINSNWESMQMRKALVIPKIKNTFQADPFLYNYKNQNYCFLEEFDHCKQKGHITAYKIKKNKIERIGIVLEEEFHLSFPFIFAYKSNIYMCPETSETNQIRIYKSKKFPNDWVLYKVINNNISSADNMIFKHNNYWWLFSNIDQSNSHDHCSELHIFYSKSPVTDKWIAHKKNPIYVDSRFSRNGGLLFSNNKIFRVSQSHGFLNYGSGVNINEIKTLDQNRYFEKKISHIRPDFFKKVRGNHHLSSVDQLTAFDFK